MTKTGTVDLFLELVACNIRHADKYWIRPEMSALR